MSLSAAAAACAMRTEEVVGQECQEEKWKAR